MKLTAMTDFVLEQHEQCISSTNATYNYAKFLKQPLELWMFVPCDNYGNVLGKNIAPEYPYNDKECDVWAQYEIYLRRCQQAKERCLFDGFQIITPSNKCHILIHKEKTSCQFLLSLDYSFYETPFQEKTIEDLIQYSLQLTQTAIKQIGL